MLKLSTQKEFQHSSLHFIHLSVKSFFHSVLFFLRRPWCSLFTCPLQKVDYSMQSKFSNFHFWRASKSKVYPLIITLLFVGVSKQLLAQGCYPSPFPLTYLPIHCDTGVAIFRLAYLTKDKTYIEVIDFSRGADIFFLHGQSSGNQTASGQIVPGNNPLFEKLELSDLWEKFKTDYPQSNSNRYFSICNGVEFSKWSCQTPLDLPMKINGSLITGGNRTYSDLNKLRILEKVSSSNFKFSNIPSPFVSNNLSTDFIVSKKPIDDNPNEQDGRTYLSFIKNNKIIIIISDKLSHNEAVRIFEDFGASTDYMALDGSQSSKLYGQFPNNPNNVGIGAYLDPQDIPAAALCLSTSKKRKIPQGLGVITGPKYNLSLKAPISISPSNISQCSDAAISVNIKNTGQDNWQGQIYISLHKSNDAFIKDLIVAPNIIIPSGTDKTVSVNVQLNTISQISAGNAYKIYVKHRTKGFFYDGEYPLIYSGNGLNPTIIPINYSANCNGYTIPPGNYKSVYLAGLNLNPQTNELEFLLQGITAQNSDIPVNISNEYDKIKKRFKQALAIPEGNQWISLDITQSGIGKATTGANFQNTELARDFLEADVNLKMSSVFKPITGFSSYNGISTYWNSLIYQGPYLSQLQGLQNLYYPYWGVSAGIDSKNLNYSSQGPTKIIINNANMEMHKRILWTELDNKVNTLSSYLRNTLQLKIDPYRTKLFQLLSTGVNNTTTLVNSNSPEFQQLRNTYRITAAAHWYKTLTNYPNKPYHSLINSNNLSGIMVNPPYNNAYWDGQALQPLPHLSETFLNYNNQGSSSYSCVGGVSFGNYNLVDSGAFNNKQVDIDTSCFNNKGYLTVDTTVYFYGGELDREIPELSPVLFHPTNRQIVLGDTISVNTTIYNFGNSKAQNFLVSLYEQYTNSQNQVQNILIGQHSIPLLDSFSSKNLSYIWTPQNNGHKNLFLSVDEGNTIIEKRENNNNATDSVEVLNNLPIVKILSPTEGSATGNRNLTLTGSATDNRDGYLQSSNLIWSSSITGFLGNGSYLTIDSLSPGNHIIRLTGTNSLGKTSFDHINIYVYPQGHAIVSISSPIGNDTFPDNAPIHFSGSALDLTDGNLCNSVVWTSNLGGNIGARCNLNEKLPVGSHTIILTVQNTAGNTSTATTNITIVPGTPHLTLINPIANTTFYQHQNVPLAATANDYPQGNLSADIRWYSNLQGFLGTGSILSLPLIQGIHTIKAVVQDNTGSADSIIISPVTILFTQPVPVIVQPTSNANFLYHNIVTLIGKAADLQDGPIHGNSLKWYSSLQGFLGFGDTLKTGALNFGNHTISLKTTDSNNADSTVSVANIFIDAGQPVCNINKPTNAASFFSGGAVTFKAIVNDPQDGLLTGTHLRWSSSIDGNLGTGDSITIHTLSAGNHIITLTATDNDGFTGTATRSIFVETPHPPSISIYYPVSNAHFLHGTHVSLKANATDYEEGMLSNNRVTWSSSINGNLGTGKTVSTVNLSPGLHIITATCIDTTGLTTLTTIQIIVDQQAPVAQITSPVAGTVFSQGTNISFTGIATDFEDGPLTGNSLQWSSNLNGNLGSGNSINTSSLSVGSHQVSLIATDSQNAKDTATIGLNVQALHTVLLKTFSNGSDSISPLFKANGSDTIIYVAIPKTATVVNAQAKITGRSDLIANVLITANPSSTITCGSPITFIATTTNDGCNPSFVWQVNGINVGTNSATFSSSGLQNGDKVRVIMTSNFSNVSENPVVSNTIIINCTP